ncbi:folylpolyglutamate synthase/dihydrofolate synthase family protein [Isoptericola sp. b441]|uniref:tetrahydrofolate synthase n=1 Tax=Actinotalea lenta TaxID=3064654 RepID=A0ABT9D8U5_9CELL|nr:MULTISPECIES: folylpolyglutamate synthase/dihydrofolate synthase family protein [unclassified Isoptericola]MDO8107311.1 folylpolyglutamate synthase/dihydrofolate synthase family protein [Isoptericola sp. b441]MDO8121027.1 folylpolyglutamate synthase/dihydrofolate synthase family protein [Isoptericola sp. b490]
MSGEDRGRAADTPEELDALQEVYAGLLARAPEHDVAPSTERVEAVCDLLGHPERSFRVLHVAGTNGKTSTARMAERLLREHGLRTGLYTSPHLTSVTERIRVDGEPLSAAEFVAAWQDVAPYVHMVDARSAQTGGPRMSYFEVLTVMAFAAFADAPVEVAVVEVGMGGRWDATNVVQPEVAVVTPIARDHERWLGHELVDIAGEKAGVLKERVTAVLAEQREEVDGVLLAAAAERGARVLREGVDLEVLSRQVAVGGQLVDLRTPGGVYADVFLPLHGEHQAHNAVLALTAVESMLRGVGALVAGPVEAAFADVSSPGRLELVRSSPAVLVDAAHNPHGAEALAAAVREAFTFERLVGVVGVLADKDAEQILAALEPLMDDVVVTRSSSERALDVADLAEVATDVFGEDRVHAVDRLDEAIARATDLAEQGVSGSPTGAGVLVTGSITLVAEARTLFGRA